MKRIILSCLVLASMSWAKNVPAATDALYQKECASCHFGYQPALLNASGWQKVMGNLKDHFGTDASLSQKEHDAILTYVTQNAGNSKLTQGNTTMRISQSPYFIKEHRRIPERLIDQPEVKSLSQCAACHTKAEQGDYSERTIVIPNYGRWE
ncbi:diheme cytochrome c [Sulfurospirillum sp. hDNRA2]|uniref:diheme cytochrome c n=1 Tax=Sulfurospirillum sp. hDNRA2 TaxID=3237298 RepID=UPI0020B85943|nr:cytochrome C [Sulfurospirillum sp. DNRA8]MCP3650797.1 cytochrome C [Sulfurospirillum sp. DNRA8]MCR1809642.1 cytochrome C [Sulfurospirillum sp. DNRA8]